MGFLDENESEREEKDEERPRPGKVLPFAPRARPEWLTGPTDDVRSAEESAEGGPRPDPQPVLTRPDAPRAPAVESSKEPREEPIADEDTTPLPERPPASWAPAASSVPVLRMPLPSSERAEEPEQAKADEPPVASPRPRGLPGGEEDRKAVPPAPPLEPLREAWWLVALDALRSDWRVQAGVGGGILAVFALGIALWPHGMDSTYLRDLRRNPARFDGQTILVRGRVGDDVYAVGGGWAFFLTQGRDTIVAFTRTRMPQVHEEVSVRGQVSTGFLDGQARQALFEDPIPEKK